MFCTLFAHYLRTGHLSVSVGDSSPCSKEIVKILISGFQCDRYFNAMIVSMQIFESQIVLTYAR